MTYPLPDLPICTANVPTPPAAPLTRTFCPARSLPLRKLCSAVNAAMAAAAACSNVMFAGFFTSVASKVHADSAKAPAAGSKHLFANLELRYLRADSLYFTGHIHA